MKWFYDQKIRTKLLICFVLVALIAGFIGYEGIRNIRKLDDADTQMYERQTVAVGLLAEVAVSFQQMRIGLRDTIFADTPDKVEKIAADISTLRSDIKEKSDAYKKLVNSKGEEDDFAAFSDANTRFISIQDRIISLASANKDAEALVLMRGDALTLAKAEQAAIDKMRDAAEKEAKDISESNTALANTSSKMMMILLCLAMIVAICSGLFIAKIISNPVKQLLDAANKLAVGDVDIKINASTNDELGDLSRAFNIMAVNTHSQADIANKIAAGDLAVDIQVRSDKDILAKALQTAVAAIKGLIAESTMLSQAAVDGKLDTRGNADKFQGGYKEVVIGVNDCLNAVIGPLNVAAEYVERISNGDIPAPITDSYNGDFNEIKNNLNKCIIAVNALVADANMLSVAAVEGRLDARADVSKHGGDFAKIVKGVNDTLDTVVDKVYWYEAILDSVPMPLSVTDIDMKWTFVNKAVEQMLGVKRTDVVGKHCSNWNANICNTENCGIARLRHNQPQTFFNQMGGNFKVDTSYILNSKSEKIGHIEFVQDITAMQKVTDFQKFEVEKLTGCLQSLANGDISFAYAVSEADEFTGDTRSTFLPIENNLNLVKSAVNALVNDANMLSVAAVEGRLDTRADASKHGGDLGKIISGFNDCLDSVIGPLNVAAEYVERISNGDIPAPITDSYNGDFNEIKNNLNKCIDGLGGLVEANTVLQRMALNDYTIPVKGDYKGIFSTVAIAVNEVQQRIQHTIGIVKNISVGNMADLAVLQQIGDGKGRRCDNDQLTPAVIDMIKNINLMVQETMALANAASEGLLSTRANSAQFNGDYRNVVESVNQCLDAVIGPLNVAAEYVERISNGDIPAPITDNYNGDFNEIKNNLNKCIKAVDALVADATMLAQAAVEGKLDTRADASKHGGDFGRIVKGVNDTLDSVIGPLNVAAEYVERISNGDIPEKITDKYNGDFNEIKNNLNQCIDGLGGLIESNAVLQRMALNDYTVLVKGDYQGIFANVAEAVNEVQDRIKHILSTVTKISVGDLTDLDAYRQIGGGKGKRCDNDQLAPAFIVMMESVGSMVSETVALAEAALDGALSTRADVTHFKGDYRKVVESVNECLDSVIDPVNEAAAVLVKLAQNDLTARVTGNYKGDHAKIKDSLNNALEALDSTMTQAAAACAKVLQTAQDVSLTAQDVGKASQSIAETINQVAVGSADQSKMVTTSSATMEQLVLAIDEVAKGAQSQAKTMEETASQVQQIAQAIESVAKTAQSAAITSSDVADIAKAGGESVSKSVKGMARIKETSANVAVAITQLGDHSKRIGAIVETIDDIAEQTNLLALNAAIEAARAGEHGKGFAVVADEVRKLAERSSMATKEIAELIGNIQQMTENAVEATQKGSSEVEAGTELANEAGEALTNILSAVNTIVQQIEDVSAASEQMSASSAEVMRAVESLSAITEQSTAATEEMAASSTDVMRSIEQVAAVSEQNAASSQGVAAAAEEQNAAMEEMTAYADESGSVARDLQEVVSQFKVSDNIEVRYNDDHVKGNGKSKTKIPAGSYRN